MFKTSKRMAGLSFGFLLLGHLNGLQATDIGFTNPDLTKKVANLFQTHCSTCHSPDDPAADLNIMDFKKIFTGTNEDGNSFIDRSASEKSYFYQMVATDKMPKQGPKLSAEEKQILLDWIKTEAPPALLQRTPISLSQIELKIQADLMSVKVDEAKSLRYLSLFNLYNSPRVSDSDLDLFRQAITKTLNSLSSSPQIALPVAVDAEKTLYRINLKDYGITPETWERIVSFYPYYVDLGLVISSFLKQATATEVPYVRADWFVFATTEPPLYHDILGIPETQLELESKLHLDVAKNIRQGKIHRAGFRGGLFGAIGSGVSDNNRVIERHEISTGAFWKSYDFNGNEGVQNIFERPLGPGPKDFEFLNAGGEIIYSLPNGLQAYMIVNSLGKRLNSAPETIVRDKTNGNRAVVNGISCMGCHSAGMNRKFDQIVPHFEENAANISASLYHSVRYVYRDDGTLKSDFDADERRFTRALAHMGTDSAHEPISALSQDFSKPIDFVRASSEIGFTSDALQTALSGNSPLLELKSSLEQGGLTREQFISKFSSLTDQLNLGKTRPASSIDSITDISQRISLLSGAGCVVQPDSSIGCWGNLNEHVIKTRPPNLKALAIAMNSKQACAIQTDQTVVCWGLTEFQDSHANEVQVELPPKNLKVKFILAAGNHVCALKLNGQPLCWGWKEDYLESTTPGGSRFSSLTGNSNDVCGIDEGHHVQCWGDMSVGTNVPKDLKVTDFAITQIGDTPVITLLDEDHNLHSFASSDLSTHQLDTGLAGIKAKELFGFGNAQLCLTTTDDFVKCFLSNQYGEATPPADLKARAVATALGISCGVELDGGIRCWGDNSTHMTEVPEGLKVKLD